jgi:hypothetical protein
MMNRYEGTVKSAVFSPELTERWGEEHGGIGYTLHIFIDLINGEKVSKVLREGVEKAVIELNVYSDPVSKRYHYLDIKTGYTKTSYLSLVSPLVKEREKILCTNRDIAIDPDVTQRALLWSTRELKLKTHRKYENEFYRMRDNKTLFYRLKKAHFRDLWIAEDRVIDSFSSVCLGQREGVIV